MKTYRMFNRGLIEGIVRAVRIWAGWHVVRMGKVWRIYRIFQRANQQRAQLYEKENLVVPPILIFSITMKCNLTCNGCYSRDYTTDNELSINEIESLFQQAVKLGVTFVVITGGEPFLLDGLMELLLRYKNLIFFLYTNSTFINKEYAEKIGRSDNIIPFLSIDGTEEDTDSHREKGIYKKIMGSMEYLNQAKAFFGFSAMVTRQNYTFLADDVFIDSMISYGCKIGLFVAYVPCGSNADVNLVPTLEQQEWFRERVLYLRDHKRIILMHMPDDEYENGGTCMAAGRGFLHINAQGYVEPCPFAHIASDSVRTKSLKETLRSPLFSYIRDHSGLLTQPSMGCALVEHKKELLEVSDMLGARLTDID